MDDLIKKALLLGAGVGLMAKEQIDAYLKKLSDMGLLNEAEARAIAKEMLARTDKEKRAFMRDIDRKMGQALRSAGLVKEKDYKRLEQKVQLLSRQVEQMKKKTKTKAKRKSRKKSKA
ncbi:MAG: hypothetical protein JXB14_03800 [Candidatus Altiarchaeota archaeon]|nr:hypothetical protein [Candidatus Altiarchaeota archaeon]